MPGKNLKAFEKKSLSERAVKFRDRLGEVIFKVLQLKRGLCES